jgi:hypothetical protein
VYIILACCGASLQLGRNPKRLLSCCNKLFFSSNKSDRTTSCLAAGSIPIQTLLYRNRSDYSSRSLGNIFVQPLVILLRCSVVDILAGWYLLIPVVTLMPLEKTVASTQVIDLLRRGGYSPYELFNARTVPEIRSLHPDKPRVCSSLSVM